MTTITGDRVGDYRAFMTCHAKDGWLDVAERELAAWMRHKYRLWDLDVSRDGRHVLPEQGLQGTKKAQVTFDVRRQNGSGGQSLRARLIETDDSGATWSTELLAHDHRGEGDWIWLAVTNDRGEFVSVPRLAKHLMEGLPLTDSAMQFVPEPQLHRHQDVEDVVEVLRDEDRHGLVFVAGTDQVGRSVDDFSRRVAAWTKEAYGLAQVIVLDPLATAEFNQQVGADHAAKAWSIRTYHPGVDTEDPSDGRRHRYLTRATQSRNVQRLLGVIARGQSASRQLPGSVEKVRRSFERLENKAIIDALSGSSSTVVGRPTLPGLEAPQAELPFETKPAQRHTAEESVVAPEVTGGTQEAEIQAAASPPSAEASPSVAEGAERYLDELDLVRSILGVRVLDEATLGAIVEEATRPHASPEALSDLEAQLERQQADIDELRDERASLESALEDAQSTQVDTQEALDKARDTERWLRNELDGAKAHEVARAEVPDDWRHRAPGSFSELLEALEAASDGSVVFTGDADVALALEVNDLGTACRAAWDAVVALRDYVRARDEVGFDGSVDRYLKHTPAGFANCPARKHAQGETAITMRQWGNQRVFPVPTEVNARGQAVMAAHFKLARIGRVSPRLHYYDDYVGTGKVYIGYIGPHLTNTHTN